MLGIRGLWVISINQVMSIGDNPPIKEVPRVYESDIEVYLFEVLNCLTRSAQYGVTVPANKTTETIRTAVKYIPL